MDAVVPVENSQSTCAVHISTGSGHLHCLHLKILQVGEAPKGMCRGQQQWEYSLVLTSWWLLRTEVASQLRAATCGWVLGLWQKQEADRRWQRWWEQTWMCLFLTEHRFLEVLQLGCISKHQTRDNLISKLSKKDFCRTDFGQWVRWEMLKHPEQVACFGSS